MAAEQLEKPLGEEDVGPYIVSVYTPEQQQRLGVNKLGEPVAAAATIEGATELTSDELISAGPATAADDPNLVKQPVATHKPEHLLAVEEISNRVDYLTAQVPTWRSIKECLLSDMDRATEFKQHEKDVRALFHERVGAFIDDFLAIKRAHGSAVERALYASMTRLELVQRLISKRPLMFMGGSDSYILRSGHNGYGGFEHIGTDAQVPPLTLDSHMSYDEIAIAATMSVGGPTAFLNNGSRYNGGAFAGPDSTHIKQGLYIGSVGARFERPERMEWRHLLITAEQNTAEKGYGPNGQGPDAPLLKAWARLYGLPYLPLYSEVHQAEEDSRFPFLPFTAEYFNRDVFRARMRLTVLPFLSHADKSAEAKGVPAYVHVVGLGLGVWMKHSSQGADLVSVYADVIRANAFENIGTLDFSWFPPDCTSCGGVPHGQQLSGINIRFSRRNPADQLEIADAHNLLVAQYAWDGNAFPGNEYWAGMLSASGDPAAAACSTIPLVHNAIFNEKNLEAQKAAVFYPDKWTPSIALPTPKVVPPPAQEWVAEEEEVDPAIALDSIENWEMHSLRLRLMRDECPELHAARQRVACIRTVPNAIAEDPAASPEVRIQRKASRDKVHSFMDAIGSIGPPPKPYSVLSDLNRAVRVWRGDVKKLAVDVVVARQSGELSRKVRQAVGASELEYAPRTASGVLATDAVALPSERLLHTPKLRSIADVARVYDEALELCRTMQCRSVALPCPQLESGASDSYVSAARVVIRAVREWLVMSHLSKIQDTDTEEDAVVQVVFLVSDAREEEIYEQLLAMYFPTNHDDDDDDDATNGSDGVDVGQWLSEGTGAVEALSPVKASGAAVAAHTPHTLASATLGRVYYREQTAAVAGSPNQVQMEVNGIKKFFTAVDIWMEEVDHMIETDDLD